MNKYYEYRRMNGLCVSCGEKAQPGKSRCIRCAQIASAREQMRQESMSHDKKEAKKKYMRKYQKEHPPNKEKRSEQNRQYRQYHPKSTMANTDRYVWWEGKRYRLGAFAEMMGINYHTLYGRLFIERLPLSEAIIKG